MKHLLILILALSNVCYADQSTLLEKDQKAPYTGYLLDQDKAEKVHAMSLNYQEALDNEKYLTDTNAIYVKRIELVSTENDKLAKQVAEQRDSSIWSKLGFFVLGAAVTTGLAFGLSRATR